MRTWSLTPQDPRTLTLSADFRFCQPDYLNDHIWEIDNMRGDGGVFGVRTSYGLRARAMRIFHAFTLNGTRISNPNLFFTPPKLIRFFPNYLSFAFSPFENLEVLAEIWVPSSDTIASRMTINNKTFNVLDLKYEVVSLLQHIDGNIMVPSKLQFVNTLAGETSNLHPVIYLTGGPEHGIGSQPSLALDIHLPALSSRKFTWAQAALADEKSSFDLARLTAARPWDVELSRIRILNEAQSIEIETGDTDWDAALALSQSNALRLFFPGGEHLPQPACVLARQPEHGWSDREDGRDHGSSWSGTTPMDAYYLSSLLPGAPWLVEGLLKNHLSTQAENGFISFRAGLVGQRGRWLAPPILASLAWESFGMTGNRTFLADAFPALLKFLQFWSDPGRAGEGGYPIWDHPQQADLEDHPAFAGSLESNPLADIRFLESPGLAAFLWRELQSLIFIANELNRSAELVDLKQRMQGLPAFIAACWNPKNGMYHYRDRETKRSLKGKRVLSADGSGLFKSRMKFKEAERLLLVVQTSQPSRRMIKITIQGLSADGSPLAETIAAHDLQWETETGMAATQKFYSSIQQVEVSGLLQTGRLVVRTMDSLFIDPSCILPLWAGISSAQEADNILKLFSTRNYQGIPTFGRTDNEIQFPWLQFYGQGLLACNKRTEASQLVAGMMDLVIHNLKQQGAFFNSYQVESRNGIGEKNSLHGFAPVGLFLKTLGVEIISSRKVRLEGINPFPWPVTLRYRGLVVVRDADHTDITFPDGRQVQVTETSTCLVYDED